MIHLWHLHYMHPSMCIKTQVDMYMQTHIWVRKIAQAKVQDNELVPNTSTNVDKLIRTLTIVQVSACAWILVNMLRALGID